MSNTISVCMIAKNEEENIARIIKCAKEFADEIIVVDTGSQDRTPEIAKELGAKVYFFEWCDNFAAARNESLKYATGDWILWLDADDFIDDHNIQKFKELKKNLPAKKNECYFFLIESKIAEGDEANWYWFQLRMFPNFPDMRFEGRIHEQIIFAAERRNLKQVYTQIKINHLGYSDPKKIEQKMMRNLKLLEQEEKEKPNEFYIKRYIAFSLAKLGKLKEAHEKINEAIKLVPKKAINWRFDLWMFKAEIEKVMGKFDDVLQSLEEAEKIRPDEGVINLVKSEIHYLKNDYEKALEELEKVRKKGFLIGIIPIAPESVKRRYLALKAKSLYKQGNYVEAKKYFIELKNVSPQYFLWDPTIDEFVDCMFKLGNYKDAYEILKEFEDRVPKYQLSNLALSAERIGKVEEAEKYYRKAYENDRENTDVIFNYANFMFSLGRYKESLELFSEYLKKVEVVPPNEIHILSALSSCANIVLKNGDLLSSVKMLETACEISGIVVFAEDIPDLSTAWIKISEKFSGDVIKLISLENALLTLKYTPDKDSAKAENVRYEIQRKISSISTKENIQNSITFH
ncbi:MAG: glycosyltransferase [Candidatus Calescibacterium sp.]|nr:glycosyltransferase [Candidatus Calescibacterium sp.]